MGGWQWECPWSCNEVMAMSLLLACWALGGSPKNAEVEVAGEASRSVLLLSLSCSQLL
jgi:hypothetical protein